MIRNHKAYPYMIKFITELGWEVKKRILQRGPLNLRELFDYKNFDGSDIYEPVVFRSTQKQKSELKEEITLEYSFVLNLIEEILDIDENGNFKLNPEEFGEKISIEFENMNDDIFLLYRTIAYFSVSHDYSSLATELEPKKNQTGKSLHVDEKIKNISDKLLKFQNEPLGVGSFKNDISEDDKGYIIPAYNLLRWNFDHIYREHEYENMSKEFNIHGGPTLNVALSIGNYRELLVKQLNRQIEQLTDINDTLLDFLSIFYINIEKNIREVWLSDESEGSNPVQHTIENDWLYIIGMMREIFDTFILNTNTEEILKYHKKTILEIPYAHKQVKDDFINQMYHMAAKKKPILEVARKLALKATICESLLEDLLMGEPIKTFNEFSKSLEFELTREDIFKKISSLKMEGMTWKKVFKIIREWLFKEHGLDEDSVKDKYGFQIKDPDTFERVMRNHI